MRKKSVRIIALLLSILLISFSLIGCSDEGKKPGVSDTSGKSQSEDVEKDKNAGGAKTSSDKKLKIGVSVNALGNIHNTHMFQSLVEEAEAAGHEVIGVSANGFAPQQATDIENLVNSGCEVIVVQNGDAFALKNVIKEAADKGIYVITEDTGWVDGNSTMFLKNSFKMAADMYMLIGSATGYSGKIITTGHQDVVNLRALTALQKVIATEYSDLKIVNHVQTTYPGTTEVAYKGISSALLKDPDVVAIWCGFDLEALGAIQALKEANLYPKVKVIGSDGEVDVLEDIKAGGSIIATTVADIEGAAKQIVQVAEDLASGKQVKTYYEIPYEMVTVENVDSFIERSKKLEEKYKDVR